MVHPQATALACYIDEGTTTNDEEDIHLFDEGSSAQPAIGTDLTSTQQTAIHSLLEEYPEVLSNQPDRTTMVEHTLNTGDSKPIRQHAYRLPRAYRDKVKAELDRMLDHHIIEPSASDYAAPIVLSF